MDWTLTNKSPNSSLNTLLPFAVYAIISIILAWRKGSVIPFTSNSGEYDTLSKDFSYFTNILWYFLILIVKLGSFFKISRTKIIPVIHTLCVLSSRSEGTHSRKESTNSGHFLIIWVAAQAAFFFILGSSIVLIMLTTSDDNSLHISGVHTSPIAFNARAIPSILSPTRSFFIVPVARSNIEEFSSMTMLKAE